ncbi:MAG: DUF192 domain-containing protein [Alphaproteobacteria bacterium]|jgi:hypothetical protein|nr:hypothetical protein [Rhodospirillaceae bacterium]MDP6406450.1 DUF192 domain-containing protein [Alphaproteobacteria bacterium]MDP6621068.1 DUF192 domain-containing protein [Alphaproteobacteria bacterium]|tara:strand:- start:1234 stop:1683 length:450 start_codon:yes stop_codon:yes gene_type:complete
MSRFLAVFVFLFLALPQAVAAGLPTTELVIATAKHRHTFTVELAANRQDRARGLMYRRTLAPDAGMLFDYGAPVRIAMWMKNTYIPLDMLFISSDGTISHIAERTVPHSLTTIVGPKPARAVLELNGGSAARLGIRVGDRVLHVLFGAK